MPDLLARGGIVAALAVLTSLLVALGRRFVAARQAAALQAAPLPAPEGAVHGVRILVFSSADCRQCHTHQAPAVARVLAARPGAVQIQEIDAPATPALATRYHILTVPATVVLDATGQARAVNYGFAPTATLLAQVDAATAA
jgi:hypothetical protein